MTNRDKTAKKRVGAVPERQNDEGVEGSVSGFEEREKKIQISIVLLEPQNMFLPKDIFLPILLLKILMSGFCDELHLMWRNICLPF